jgi:hypothetical protein
MLWGAAAAVCVVMIVVAEILRAREDRRLTS